MSELLIHHKDFNSHVKRYNDIRNKIRETLYDIANFIETEDFVVRKNWEDNIDILSHDIFDIHVIDVSVNRDKIKREDKIVTALLLSERDRSVEEFVLPMELIYNFDPEIIYNFYG